MVAMDDRVQFLRRRIVLYRRYLGEGVVGEIARKYLSEIAKAESELAEIEKDRDKCE
jgi:hypothetical protein